MMRHCVSGFACAGRTSIKGRWASFRKWGVLLCVAWSFLRQAVAEDIAPLSAPENALIAQVAARTEGIPLRLAPLTQRVWGEHDLPRLCAESVCPQADAVRRLLLGVDAPQARASTGFVLFTGEDSARLAGRFSGVFSLASHADAVLSIDTTRSLYEQRPLLPAVPIAQLRLYTALGEWRMGQAPIRWGGGYSGAMLLSDHAPPLPHLSYRQRWHFGKRLGTWQFEQMMTVLEEDGSRRYLMARRLSRDLSPRWHLSFAEAFKATKLPAGALAPVLPFYLYQHRAAWHYYNGRDEWFNYLAEVQLQYRWRGQKVYLDLLLDDLQAPRWLTRFRYTTPRKSGVLLGYRAPLPRGGQFVMEFAHTDGNPGGGTYSYKIPENRWRYRDAILGHPVGTNRDMLYVRLDVPVAERGYLTVEHVNTRRANATPLVPVEQRWTVHAAWMLPEGYFLGARWNQRTEAGTTRERWLLHVGKLF